MVEDDCVNYMNPLFGGLGELQDNSPFLSFSGPERVAGNCADRPDIR